MSLDRLLCALTGCSASGLVAGLVGWAAAPDAPTWVVLAVCVPAALAGCAAGALFGRARR